MPRHWWTTFDVSHRHTHAFTSVTSNARAYPTDTNNSDLGKETQFPDGGTKVAGTTATSMTVHKGHDSVPTRVIHPDEAVTQRSSLINLNNIVAQAGNYALSLIDQFETSGNIQHLENAIEFMRLVLQKTPITTANYAASLNVLAMALDARFKQQSNAQDLDEAISLYRQSLKPSIG